MPASFEINQSSICIKGAPGPSTGLCYTRVPPTNPANLLGVDRLDTGRCVKFKSQWKPQLQLPLCHRAANECERSVGATGMAIAFRTIASVFCMSFEA